MGFNSNFTYLHYARVSIKVDMLIWLSESSLLSYFLESDTDRENQGEVTVSPGSDYQRLDIQTQKSLIISDNQDTAENGHVVVVVQFIVTQCNVNLVRTIDGVTSFLKTTEMGHTDVSGRKCSSSHVVTSTFTVGMVLKMRL